MRNASEQRINPATQETLALLLAKFTHYTFRKHKVGTTTYFGIAAPGSSESSPVWLVVRYVSGDDSSLLYADGNDNFDNTWTGQTGHTYS